MLTLPGIMMTVKDEEWTRNYGSIFNAGQKKGHDIKMCLQQLYVLSIIYCVADQVLAVSYSEQNGSMSTAVCRELSRRWEELAWSCMESGGRAERLVKLSEENRKQPRRRPLSSGVAWTRDDCEPPVLFQSVPELIEIFWARRVARFPYHQDCAGYWFGKKWLINPWLIQ